MTDAWPAPGFASRLAKEDRVMVLFHASWCPFSASVRAEFDDASPESSIPFVRADVSHPLDARWDEHRIHTVPTLLYFEKGEELERLEAERRVGLTTPAIRAFIEHAESLAEDDRPKWMQRRKRQPTSRRP